MKVVPAPVDRVQVSPRMRTTLKVEPVHSLGSIQSAQMNRRMSNYNRRHPRGGRNSTADGRESTIPEVYLPRSPSRSFIIQRYHDLQAHPIFVMVRKFFRGKFFGGLSAVCLIGALYLPDTFVLVGSSSATFSDAVLTIIMATFGLEFLLLSITDQTYILSTWWWMDLVGTLSMVFDISYLLLDEPNVPRLARTNAEGSDKTGALVYLRAGRMAKLGARAGRISRVLKILRFLPFLHVAEHDSTTMARKISNQLSQVLGTRVAVLTLTLTILVPIPGIFQFPVDDYSLRTVSAALARRAVELMARANINASNDAIGLRSEDLDRFHMEVRNVADFYDKEEIGYGPYRIFFGRCMEEPARCDEFPAVTQKLLPTNAWTQRMSEPHRLADSYMISANLKDITAYNATAAGTYLAGFEEGAEWKDFEFITAFNFRSPHVIESSWNMGVITFVMAAMIGCGLLLSNSVSELAVRPMERMLQMVREIARTVFTNFRVEEEEEDEYEGDVYDVDNYTEMALLERIVRRLASMAELTTKQVIDVGMERSEMKDEDVGILNLMCGGESEVAGSLSSCPSMLIKLNQSPCVNEIAVPETGIEIPVVDSGFGVLGVDEATFYSWDFNPMTIESLEQRIAIPAWIIRQHPGSGEFAQKIIPPDKLRNCMVRAEKEYLDQPYHNFCHAIDIVHTVHRFLIMCRAPSFLSELEQMTLLIAAVYHDVAHPGVNNPYLIDTAHELALRYNDRSPLENMHCAKLFSILSQKETAMLDGLSKEQYKESRRICVEVILHTDVTQHFGMVKSLNILYQVNSEIFDYCDLDYPLSAEEATLYKNPETKKLMLNMFLHTADVSNPCKTWPVCLEWAELVLEEFFRQGDKEKALGLTVQMLNDRNKVNKPNSQLGFIEFIVCPLIVSCVRLLPYLYELADNLESNVNQWSGVWIAESAPAQEEIDKLNARLEKVAESVQESKIRIVNLSVDVDISTQLPRNSEVAGDVVGPMRSPSKQVRSAKTRNTNLVP